jgi:hypothetical protein
MRELRHRLHFRAAALPSRSPCAEEPTAVTAAPPVQPTPAQNIDVLSLNRTLHARYDRKVFSVLSLLVSGFLGMWWR